MPLTRRKLLQHLALIPAGLAGVALLDDWVTSIAQANELEGTHKAPKGVPLVYHPKYNIKAFGLERLHPFDGSKFSKIRQHLIEAGLRDGHEFLLPEEMRRDQLLKVHTDEYLDSLRHSHVIAKIMQVMPAAAVPGKLLDWKILHPMRIASGGTLLACRTALQRGMCINVGGGFHHAHATAGGGFCVYSDVPISLNILREAGAIKRALIVDTDAHQGNGFAIEATKQRTTFVLDLFEEAIYPWPKVSEDISVALPSNATGAEYLAALKENVPTAIAKYEPDLIVYNAGSDVLASDPLSSLQVSVDDFVERDNFVINHARKHNIPIAMVLAGGYGPDSAIAHARSIEQIVRTHDASI